jgi:hypothetical protein
MSDTTESRHPTPAEGMFGDFAPSPRPRTDDVLFGPV